MNLILGGTSEADQLDKELCWEIEDLTEIMNRKQLIRQLFTKFCKESVPDERAAAVAAGHP